MKISGISSDCRDLIRGDFNEATQARPLAVSRLVISFARRSGQIDPIFLGVNVAFKKGRGLKHQFKMMG
jgi:hypothetical protein